MVKGRRLKSTGQGLSLLELLVVLSILGVLLVVVLPMYNNITQRTYRHIAIAELNQVLARQEQFFQENKHYAVALDGLGLPAARYGIDARGTRVHENASQRVYLISLSSVSSGFLVSAEPQLSQSKDTLCGTLSLQNDGRRFSSSSAGVEECW